MWRLRMLRAPTIYMLSVRMSIRITVPVVRVAWPGPAGDGTGEDAPKLGGIPLAPGRVHTHKMSAKHNVTAGAARPSLLLRDELHGSGPDEPIQIGAFGFLGDTTVRHVL